MTWDNDRAEKLKALWNEGLTASHISKRLGGVTRNAVIGKAHRLKLYSRPRNFHYLKKEQPHV